MAGIETVDIADIPQVPRSRRAATPLRAALEALVPGKALKIERKSGTKAAESSRLYSAARSAGVKVHVSVDDTHAFIWLNESKD